MKQKLIEFLELEKQTSPEAIVQRVAQSRTIAPLAVNKLLEAVGLLKEIEQWIEHEEIPSKPLRDKIKKFTEDFNNEN